MEANSAPVIFIRRPNNFEGENVHYIRKPEDIPGILAALGQALPTAKMLIEADELSYTDYRRLENVFSPCPTANLTPLLRNIRMIKTPYEINLLRISASLHEKTYSEIPDCFRPGMTDLELQAEIELRMRRNGSLGSFRTFGEMDIFMGSVLTGNNAQTPSPYDFALGGAGADASLPIGADGTILKTGTSVMIDMAGNYTAYLTDMTRTFSIGELPEYAYAAHLTACRIEKEIASVMRPGLPASEPYRIAMDIAQQAGLADRFMGTRQQAKFVGHGVGLQINELPVLTARSKDVLEEGMTIAVEPKFVIPDVGAVGIEDTYLITADGAEQITYSPKEILNLLYSRL
jgi:Xaa-Pro aminopeptidase